jgi:hypothetical protein
VRWHEPGGFDYSGDYEGAEEVVGLLAGLLGMTGGDFRLERGRMISIAEYVAARRSGGRADPIGTPIPPGG